MKKRILCMLLGIVMVTLCLTSFTHDVPAYLYYEPTEEEEFVFPPEVPSNLILQLANEPCFLCQHQEHSDFVDHLNFPTTLPQTELTTGFLYTDIGGAGYGNVLITSQEELDCLFSWHFDMWGGPLSCNCQESEDAHTQAVLKWGGMCCNKYPLSSRYKQLSEIDYSEKAVLILGYNAGSSRQISRVVVDQDRLIVVLSNYNSDYSDWGCLYMQGETALLIDKAELPVTDGEIGIYYCVEHPDQEIYYSPERVMVPLQRYYFTEVDENTAVEPNWPKDIH